MAVCVVLTADATRVPFGRAAAEADVDTVALQQTVASRGDVLAWAAADAGAYGDALAAETNVGEVRQFAALEEGTLYRCEWLADGLYGAVTAVNGLVMDAAGSPDRWSFRLWFPDERAASEFDEACRADDVETDIDRVRSVSDAEFSRYGLSESQAALLLRAFDAGYFEVPRTVTLQELADSEDVSGQSLSARLRRAVHALVENTLVSGGNGG